MSRFQWSRLYPRSWQEEFGDEFDELNRRRGVRFSDAVDILIRATLLRMAQASRLLPFLVAWIGVGYLNIHAYEVQWAAGGLLVSAFCASLVRPQKWLHYAFFFFIAIPASTLLLYQDASVKHVPLYQTSVAILPPMIGALLGRISGLASLKLRSQW